MTQSLAQIVSLLFCKHVLKGSLRRTRRRRGSIVVHVAELQMGSTRVGSLKYFRSEGALRPPPTLKTQPLLAQLSVRTIIKEPSRHRRSDIIKYKCRGKILPGLRDSVTLTILQSIARGLCSESKGFTIFGSIFHQSKLSLMSHGSH